MLAVTCSGGFNSGFSSKIKLAIFVVVLELAGFRVETFKRLFLRLSEFTVNEFICRFYHQKVKFEKYTTTKRLHRVIW